MDAAKSPEQLRGVVDTYYELMNAQKENLIIQRDAAGLPRSTLPDYTMHSADDKGDKGGKKEDAQPSPTTINHGDILNQLPPTAPKGAVAKNATTGKPEYIFNGTKWIPVGSAK